jgi:hypothetical protein
MKRIIIAAGLILSAPVFAQTTSQTTAPNTGGMTHISVTCGTTSTAFGVAGSQYLTVQVPTTAAAPVFFGWGGTQAMPTTATTTTASQSYAAGSLITWGGGTGSCIVAFGTQAITVGYR